MQYAARWAAERGMLLDEALTMRDEGLSAYHQQHIKTGALGIFLAAVGAGKIRPGSVLIVEGLDRLSRAEPLQAQAQLAQIINAGITVVTASDGREYTRDGLRTNPMDLVYSLLVMIRAHEESETKSKRVTASIRRLCEQWTAGTYRGPVRNGKDPKWLRPDGTGWAIDEARAALVLEGIALYRAGHGPVRIARRLAETRATPDGQTLAPQHLYKLVRQRCLYGCKELQVDGETHLLDDYYPALMTRDEWEDLQILADDRGRRRVRGELPHIITGAAITRCGYCNTPMAGQHLTRKPRLPDGRIRDCYRRLQCGGKVRGNPCPVPGSCSVAPIERALMRYCSDQMLLSELLRAPDTTPSHRAELAEARSQADTLQRQMDRLTAALASDDDQPAPASILRRVRELETQHTAALHRITAAERTLHAAAAAQARTHDQAARWAALAGAVEAQDYDARQMARQMVADTFSGIQVWHRGMTGDHPREVVIVLQAHGGQPRALTIDRLTGELIKGLQGREPPAPSSGAAPS